MPELAEVSILADDLNQAIGKSHLVKATRGSDLKWSRKIISPYHAEFLDQLIPHFVQWEFASLGKSLLAINRFQSNLYVSVIKLGMTGGFRTHESSLNVDDRHKLYTFEFSNGQKIHYIDYRRFGKWYFKHLPLPENLYRRFMRSLDENGIDIDERHESRFRKQAEEKIYFANFSDWIKQGLPGHIGGFIRGKFDLDASYANFYYESLGKIKRTRGPRISLLLESGPWTGIGNYMANEALGKLDLSPFEPFANREEFTRTVNTCLKIAAQSFVLGGNSFNGGYYRLDGSLGSFSSQMKFYQQKEIPRSVFKGRPVYSRFQSPSFLHSSCSSLTD